MDIEKLIYSAVTVGASWLAAYHGVVFRSGKEAQKHETETETLLEVKGDVKTLKEAMLAKVSQQHFEQELKEVHERISSMQKAQAEASFRITEKLEKTSEGIATLKGMMEALGSTMGQLLANAIKGDK